MAYNEPINRGTPDADLFFCTAQAIPVDGADDISENIIDMQNVAPRILAGEKATLKVQITTLIAVASGSASKMDFDLGCAATETTVGAQTTVSTALISLGYDDAKGKIYSAALPDTLPTYLTRYLSLILNPRSADTLYSAGAIDAWIAFE